MSNIVFIFDLCVIYMLIAQNYGRSLNPFKMNTATQSMNMNRNGQLRFLAITRSQLVSPTQQNIIEPVQFSFCSMFPFLQENTYCATTTTTSFTTEEITDSSTISSTTSTSDTITSTTNNSDTETTTTSTDTTTTTTTSTITTSTTATETITTTSTTSTTTSTTTTSTTTTSTTTTSTTTTSTTTTSTTTSTTSSITNTSTTTSTTITTTITTTSTTTTSTATSSTTTTSTTTTSTTTTSTITITTSKSYLGSCLRNEDCDSSKNLSCFTISSGCNCPSISLPFTCDCDPSLYWNTSACVRRKSHGEPCISEMNYECGYGLYCNSSVCSCASNEYWNSSYCVSKLLLYFTSYNYTTVIIDNFNGYQLDGPMDVQVVEKPNYYIYVTVNGLDILLQYDQSGSFIALESVPGAYGVQPTNNSSVYVTGLNVMYKFDLNLNNKYCPSIDPTYTSDPRYVRYNPSNGYLYQCDYGTGYINAFDWSYNRISTESFALTSNERPVGIEFYHSSYLGDLIFITTTNNHIMIVLQLNKAIYKTLSSICVNQYPAGILFDQKSGYFLVSCFDDNAIQLWSSNGSDFINTGRNISTVGPTGMHFDSYGRLLIANYYGNTVSILTPLDYPF